MVNSPPVRVFEGPRNDGPSCRLPSTLYGIALIPPELRPNLFEPYISSKEKGSGLGLAIVSRIVSDHSGYIRVRDNAPRGTRFIIELPVRT